MKEKIDWDLIGKYLTGETSGEENILIKTWLESDPDNQKLIDDLKEVWNSPVAEPPLCDVSKMKSEILSKSGITKSRKVKERIIPSLHFYRYSRILRYAAALIVSILSTYFLANFLLSTENSQNTGLNKIVVKNGIREQITLSDGTAITLDAGSEFSYPENFGSETREVFLKGEAFFEVKSLAGRPFIVYAENAVVMVLGTKFNVKAWQETNSVEVVVSEGNVMMRSRLSSDEEAVIIRESQMSEMVKDSEPFAPQDVPVENYISWLNNEKRFENTKLIEIVSQIERWYDLTINIENKQLLSVRMTMLVQKKEPAKDYIDLISSILDIDYVISEKTVTFKQGGTDTDK
ncbi:FecR family protein [candidate division KSB1 bacterium]